MTSCGRIDFDRISKPITVNVIGIGTKSPTDYSTVQTNGFVLDAWVDDDYMDYSTDPATPYTERHFIDWAAVDYGTRWTINGDPNWVAKVTTRFWARYPKPASINGTLTVNPPISPSDEVLTFSYTMPTTASNSDDIVFSYAKKAYDGNNGESIDLIFHHAMARVLFAVKPGDGTDGTISTDLKIKSIKLSDMKGTGDCTYTPVSPAPYFSWNNLGTPSDMTHEFTSAATFSTEPSASVDNWTTSAADTNGNFICDHDFFVIPQDMTGAKVIIKFSNGTNDNDAEVSLTDVFEPGCYYVYRISASSNVIPPETVFDSVSIKKLYATHENYTDAGQMDF